MSDICPLTIAIVVGASVSVKILKPKLGTAPTRTKNKKRIK
jgi:hypothetical protein